ncbi:CPBP family intramembrane glutamic endopeptidase [Cytophagaceae bacterium ABcell3]|nr:CPBP family intramembrane glutamic endopeptidase [Cytophagaceae bacterium ABcell3]
MENRHTEDIPGPLKVLKFAGILLRLFGFLIVGAFITRGLVTLLTGEPIAELEDILAITDDEQRQRNLLLIMQGASAFSTFLLLPLLYIIYIQKDLRPTLQFQTPRFSYFLVLAVAIFFTAMPFISYLVEWNQQWRFPVPQIQEAFEQLDERAEKLTRILIYFEDFYEIFPILLVVAILPGIGEELLFRGIIQNEMRSIVNPHIAIWVTAILFSIIHFQFQGFLPRVALGALFGYLYYWSGNLWIPIIIHFINNSFTFAIMSYARITGTPEETETAPALTFILTLVSVMLIVAYQRLSLAIKNQEHD